MMTDDISIVDSLKSGDDNAVRRLIDAYGTRLTRSACLLCGNETDAQDIVQETFITAIKSIKKFKGNSKLYTWLHGILINITRHWLRRKKTHVALDDIPDRSDNCADVKDVERRSTKSALMKSIQKLSPEQREVVVLRYFEEMTIPEIAAATHTRKGTVKSRLHYALEKLKAIVPEDMHADIASEAYPAIRNVNICKQKT